MNFIINFIRKEEERKQIEVVAYSNGVKYVIENDPLVARTFHTFFKPLNNEQILKLEDDVNNVQKVLMICFMLVIAFMMVGAIGADLNLGTGGISAKGAFLWGLGLSIDW